MRTPEQSPSAAAPARPVFLVVEDSDVLCREIARILTAHGDCILAGSMVEAIGALDASHRWAGAIVDVHLPGGSGLDIVARVRKQNPTVAVLVISGDLEPENINGVYRIGVSFLAKPFAKGDILRFADAAVAGPDTVTVTLCAHVERLGLSRDEADILMEGVRGDNLCEIAARHDCTLSALQTHISSMSTKSGGLAFGELVAGVLKEAAALSGLSSSKSILFRPVELMSNDPAPMSLGRANYEYIHSVVAESPTRAAAARWLGVTPRSLRRMLAKARPSR
jgi:ActR/RegA family two-component response regulator